MIDQNRDGVIDIEDLKDIYSNLGVYIIFLYVPFF